MKRFLIFFLCISTLLPLLSCARQEDIQKPVTFYYRRANIAYAGSDGVVSTEQRESLGHEGNIDSLLAMYLSGPLSPELAQTFPDGTFLVSIQQSGTTAKATFSFHLASLSGIDLTVACACITMTLTELMGVETVQISAAGALLDDYQYITMDKNCLLLLDSGANTK